MGRNDAEDDEAAAVRVNHPGLAKVQRLLDVLEEDSDFRSQLNA